MCHLVQGIWINFIPPGNQKFFIKTDSQFKKPENLPEVRLLIEHACLSLTERNTSRVLPGKRLFQEHSALHVTSKNIGVSTAVSQNFWYFNNLLILCGIKRF